MPTADTDKLPPLAELEAEVQHCPHDVEALRRLANGYSAIGQFELAAELLKHAVQLAPRDARTRAQLGWTLIETCDPREAVAQMEEAARLDPGPAAERAFDLGAAWAEAGEHATAASHFRRALELQPRMRGAWSHLARALAAAGQFAEAIPAFERATAVRPNDAALWTAFGRACAGAGDDAKALQSFRVALRIDPTQAVLHFAVGARCERLGRFADAVAAYSEAARLTPRNPAPHAALGDIALHRKRPHEAVQHFRRAVCLKPRDARLWQRLCDALDAAGHTRAATEAARQRVRLAPDSVAALIDVALYHRAAGRHDEAARNLVRAAELEPDNRIVVDELRDQLALLNDRLQFQPACEALEKLVKLNPKDAPAWRQLGWIYSLFLRHADAITALRHAVTLAPGDMEAWDILGRVLELEHDGPGVVAAFECLLEVSPNHAQDFYASHIQGRPWESARLQRPVTLQFWDPVMSVR